MATGGTRPLHRITKPVRISAAVVLILAAASAVSNVRSPANQAPLLTGAHIPPEVRAAIEKACRDCHSEATSYPWYSYIAPVSWLINHDVTSGRKHLNFSRWSEYTVTRRERCLSEIANQVQDGGMPLGIYVVMHPSARLSEADVHAIFEWTQAERARLIAESFAATSPQ
jgi:heme-binding protein